MISAMIETASTESISQLATRISLCACARSRESATRLTLIEPDGRRADPRPETRPRGRRLPDLPDGPALEEVVDGDKDIRQDQRDNGAPDDPQINLLRRNQTQKEQGDRKADEEDSKEVSGFSSPQPHEGLRDLIGLQIINVPSYSMMIGIH